MVPSEDNWGLYEVHDKKLSFIHIIWHRSVGGYSYCEELSLPYHHWPTSPPCKHCLWCECSAQRLCQRHKVKLQIIVISATRWHGVTGDVSVTEQCRLSTISQRSACRTCDCVRETTRDLDAALIDVLVEQAPSSATVRALSMSSKHNSVRQPIGYTCNWRDREELMEKRGWKRPVIYC